jgi:hypothetical protein
VARRGSRSQGSGGQRTWLWLPSIAPSTVEPARGVEAMKIRPPPSGLTTGQSLPAGRYPRVQYLAARRGHTNITSGHSIGFHATSPWLLLGYLYNGVAPAASPTR